MKGYKVWGGLTFTDGKQVRTIVATKNKTTAARLLDVTIGTLNNYWSITRNELEVSTAMSHPGCVYMASTSMGFDFKRQIRNRLKPTGTN